jgi:hypothetical protein
VNKKSVSVLFNMDIPKRKLGKTGVEVQRNCRLMIADCRLQKGKKARGE